MGTKDGDVVLRISYSIKVRAELAGKYPQPESHNSKYTFALGDLTKERKSQSKGTSKTIIVEH